MGSEVQTSLGVQEGTGVVGTHRGTGRRVIPVDRKYKTSRVVLVPVPIGRRSSGDLVSDPLTEVEGRVRLPGTSPPDEIPSTSDPRDVSVYKRGCTTRGGGMRTPSGLSVQECDGFVDLTRLSRFYAIRLQKFRLRPTVVSYL